MQVETQWNEELKRTFRSYNSMVERTRIVEGSYWYGMCVEDSWLDSFKSFLGDVGVRPEGHTLDRIDNSKGYLKGNVRWATPTTQVRNRRNTIRVDWEGESTPLAEVCESLGKDYDIVRGRLKLGMSLEEAISKPKRHNWTKLKLGDEELTLPKYCAKFGKCYNLVRDRLRNGWSLDRALNTLKRRRKR